MSMMHWMFCCKDVSQKVSESMDRKLPLHHRMFIRIHLMMCKYCSRFRRQLLLLREMSGFDQIVDASTEFSAGLSLEAQKRIKDSLKSLY
jgi:hypothetical protein